MKRCVSCGRNSRDFAEVLCPECGKKLVRCYFCRENRNKYECSCGFVGP